MHRLVGRALVGAFVGLVTTALAAVFLAPAGVASPIGDAEAAMMDAWENGGEKGFMDWATGHWGNEYLDDWKFDAVDGIDIERPYGGGWR